MPGQFDNWDYQWGQIVGRAWADDDFQERLLAHPAEVLKEYELAPPASVRIEVLNNPQWVPQSTDEVLYLVLPAKPSDEELSEEELCSAGGTMAGCRSCSCEGCRCESCSSCSSCRSCSCEGCRCESCRGCHHPPRPTDD
jgi:hypothetical protein